MTGAPFDVVVIGASVPEWVEERWPAARVVPVPASLDAGCRVATSWWHATEQRTMSEAELRTAAAHHGVWLKVVGSGRTAVVLDGGAVLVGDVEGAVTAAVGGIGGARDAATGGEGASPEEEPGFDVGPLVVLADADDPAAGYVVTPAGAGALVAIVDAAGLAPADAVLARAGRLLQVQPPVVRRRHRPSAGPVHRAHLCISDDPPASTAGVWCHPGPFARLVGEPEAVGRSLLLGLAQLGGGLVVSADGTAAIGPTPAVRAWSAAVDGGDEVDEVEALVDAVVDADRRLFLPAAEDPGEWTVLAGRLHHARTGTTPVVMTGDDHRRSGAALVDARLAADRSEDLVRLLAYVDAVDPLSPWEGWTEVAPELLQVPLWTPEFCAVVVRAVQACGAWEPNPDDPVPGRELPLTVLSGVLGSRLDEHLRTQVWPVLHQHWPYAEDQGIDDAFVITYAVGEQEELRIHHDLAQISASVKLNDGYEGGVLTFPRQGWDNRQQPVGSMLVWPSLVTHPHLSTPITAGVKHALTIWFRLPQP